MGDERWAVSDERLSQTSGRSSLTAPTGSSSRQSSTRDGGRLELRREPPAAEHFGHRQQQLVVTGSQWQVHGIVRRHETEVGWVPSLIAIAAGIEWPPIQKHHHVVAVAEAQPANLRVIGVEHGARDDERAR